jgi:hypothetical protein
MIRNNTRALVPVDGDRSDDGDDTKEGIQSEWLISKGKASND